MNGVSQTAGNALATLGGGTPASARRGDARADARAATTPFADRLAAATPVAPRTPASATTEPETDMTVPSVAAPAIGLPGRTPAAVVGQPTQPNATTLADARATLAALADAARLGDRTPASTGTLPARTPLTGLALREVATTPDTTTPAPVADGSVVSPLAQMLALMTATPAAAAQDAVTDAAPDLLLAPRASGAATSPAQAALTAPAHDVSALLAAMPAIPRDAAATTAAASDASAAFALAVVEAGAPRDGDDARADGLPDIDGTTAVGALATSARTSAANAPAAIAAPMTMPAQPDDGFDDGFGARIAWMAEQKLGHAEIRLNPEHVGRIDVRVQLDGTRVMAEFHSAHADVRQALEASLPRLRDMLGQHGLQLGHADIGQRQSNGDRAPQQGQATHGTGGTHDDGALAGDSALRSTPILRSRGLLDEYA